MAEPIRHIETDVEPVSPQLMEFAKLIRDDRNSTLREKQLAAICLNIAITLNELLGRLEVGMVKITDDIKEVDTRRFFPRR